MNKKICFNCGKIKEDYESAYCNKCWEEEQKRLNTKKMKTIEIKADKRCKIMKIEDLKTEKIIKLFGLQNGCMSEEKLWEIIKINKDHNNEYVLEMEHGLIDSKMLMILLRSGYTMEIYNDNMLRFKVV